MTTNKVTNVSIVGGSGYAGGELLRILLGMENINVKQITSQSLAGKPVVISHPNLRGSTNLTFCKTEELESCDVLFLAMPHLEAVRKIDYFISKADKIIDLSADFRLKDNKDYVKFYDLEHPRPELLSSFTGGIAEINRENIKGSKYISCAGCEATCSILSLYPLIKAGIIDREELIIDVKIGSSAAGNKPSVSSHHPERSGSFRSYKATNHRHTAEIEQELGIKTYLSATAVEAVRGILTTAQVFLKDELSEREIRKIYNDAYSQEPFVRIIKERQGIYRYPEPKILSGTNFCDIGFEREEGSKRLVVIGAIDNLVKGTAGQAIQAMNISIGQAETTGLEFTGLHPI